MRTLVFLLALMVGLALPALADDPLKDVRNGPIITGVDLPVLLRAAINDDTLRVYDLMGGGCEIERGGKWLGRVCYLRVCPDDVLPRERAKLRDFAAQRVPTPPEVTPEAARNPILEEGDGIGDLSVRWAGTGFLLFICGNVSVMMQGTEETVETAKAISSALRDGRPGVTRGFRLPKAPEMRVEAPERIVAGTTVTLKVRVTVPQQGRHDGLDFKGAGENLWANGVLPFKWEGDPMEIAYTAKYSAPKDITTAEFAAEYVSDTCVVTRKTFTLAISRE
jgi:hypothetical protein